MVESSSQRCIRWLQPSSSSPCTSTNCGWGCEVDAKTRVKPSSSSVTSTVSYKHHCLLRSFHQFLTTKVFKTRLLHVVPNQSYVITFIRSFEVQCELAISSRFVKKFVKQCMLFSPYQNLVLKSPILFS